MSVCMKVFVRVFPIIKFEPGNNVIFGELRGFFIRTTLRRYD